ncbi:MAG TPA: serine hydrolase domain-containing protein [Syntrophorhabdaceae bacterium]|jgi:CubicO group peptidase (beta-lactamase class C family)
MRIKRILSIAAAAGLFFVLSFFDPMTRSYAADPYVATIAEGRAAAGEVMASTGASSISLAFIDGEQVVWAEAFGLADKETSVAPTTETMYGIGSTSKIVAAMAVMKLVDQKKVVLDAPLTRYIPSFTMSSSKYRQITVRQLLNHSSGFPGTDYRNAETTSPSAGYSAQVLSTLSDSRLKHNPGFMNVYCNDGLTVIEQLVSSVTGKEYAQFMEDEIFTPLGMGKSRYPLDYFPYGAFAHRYSGTTRLPQLFVNALASGGLYSTPTDMAKLAMVLMGKGKIGERRLLSRASVAAMGVDQTIGRFNPAKSYALSYGLGLDSVHQPGLKAVGVTGWHKGGDVTLYGSAILIAPVERLAVVVIGASGTFGSDRATYIAERILLRALVEKGKIAAMPVPLNLQPLPVRTPSAGLLSALRGYYIEGSTLLRIEPQPGRSLTMYRWDTGTGDWTIVKSGLKFRSDGTFTSDAEPGTAFSFKAAQGRRYLIARTVGGYGHYRDYSVSAEKTEAAGDLPAPWANRLGRKWLMVNESPQAGMWNAPVAQLMSIDNLLFVRTTGFQPLDPFLSDTRAGMTMLVPQMNGRDQNDLMIETRESEEWVRFGSYLYRPAETVQGLNSAGDTVTIGAEGFAEWRSVVTGAEKTISVVTVGPWKLYDSGFAETDTAEGTKTITLPAGTHYMLFHGNAEVTSAFPASQFQAMLDASVSDTGLPGVVLAVSTPIASWVGAGGKSSLTTGALRRSPEVTAWGSGRPWMPRYSIPSL